MGYQPLEDLLPKTDMSIYTLVRLAADRAIELAEGKRALVVLPGVEKLATIALEEIWAGKVVLASVAHKFRPVQLPVKDQKIDSEPKHKQTEDVAKE